MTDSYQNGGGTAPQRIDHLGHLKRKRFRRKLFLGLYAFIIAVLVLMMFVVLSDEISHRKHISAPVNLDKLNSMTDADSLPSGCETTVILSRHCEKSGAEVEDEDGDQHCSYLGFERAQFFAGLFGDNGWPVPSLLYALAAKRGSHFNFREIETVTPLANKFGLDLNEEYSTNTDLADDVLEHISSGEMCGKTTVVSWKHEMIGPLAGLLACVDCPKEYPNQFDQVWQLKYVYDVGGTAIFQKINSGENTMLRQNPGQVKSWSVYYTSVKEEFDPLKYSNSVGDYIEGGGIGAHWSDATTAGDDEM